MKKYMGKIHEDVHRPEPKKFGGKTAQKEVHGGRITKVSGQSKSP